MKKLAVTLGVVLLFGGLTANRGYAQKNELQFAEAVKDYSVPVISKEEALRHLSNLPNLDEAVARRLATEQRKVGQAVSAVKGGGKAEEGYFTVPFVNNFDQKAEFEDNWECVDRDGDGYSWGFKFHDEWPAVEGSTEGGCVYNSVNDRDVDDWLIMKKPVRLSGEKAYIAFLYSGTSIQTYAIERLAVYYGTEKDPDKMKPLADWEFYGRDWMFKYLDVEVPAAGDYYFAIRALSKEGQLSVHVDEIEIGEGAYQGAPNLVMKYVYLPLSSCALTEGEVSVLLVNRGKTAIERFALSYSVNGGETVREEFAKRIPLLDTVKVTFARKADLSESGKTYKFRVEGEVLATENNVLEPDKFKKDNVMEDRVVHFTPTELPFITDMNKAEDRAQWGFASGTWDYNPLRVLAIRSEDTLPMISRCMPLSKERNYRFAFDYVGGIDIFGLMGTEVDFDVLCGIAGTPVDGWTVVKRYEKVMTENLLVSDEIVFSPDADGFYAFAIVSRTKFGVLYIQKVSVSEIKEHDVVLQDWVTRLGRLTPARHAVNPSFEALVANRGMNDETDVEMVIRRGDEIIGGSTTKVAIRKDSLVVFRPIDGTIKQPELNSEEVLRLAVEMPTPDGNPYNNIVDFTFVATDTVYAFDNVSENPTHGVGSTFAMGNIFTLAEQDTLTSVTIAWVDVSQQVAQDFDVAIEVYPVDMLSRRVGNTLLHHEVKRGLKGGIRTVEIPAHVMSPGSYLIGLRQLGNENISVAVDENTEDGYFFITGNGTYAIQADRGFLGVRANFGEVHSLKLRDIEVLDIESPKNVGAFTANQLIRANYINHGFETMEVEFKCTVGEQVLTSKKTVKGYETGRVSFTADLSKVGSHTITVEAVADNDENPDNNAARKTVECVVIDARIMNFEYCDDFAIHSFLPAWQSVDMDGTVPGPHKLTFPNANVPFGFMAFNSYLAGETDDAGQVVNVAHGGERCGMSLVTPKNNDWLISPEFSMAPKADSLGVSLWVRSWDPDYKEWYNVLVSTTNNSVGSFEVIPDENGALLREAPGDWTRVWVDLSAYAGKNIFVAIQCVSEDAWMFFVDDIEVKTGGLGNEPDVDLSRYVRSYPNPVTDVWTVTAYDLEIQRVEIFNMTGGVVFRSADKLGVETYRVHMGGFTPGLYTARVHTNVGVQTLKIVVR